MRVLFALPGLHRFDRGAEVAFTSIAKELANSGDAVTLIGSGPIRLGMPYRYIQAKCVSRVHFNSLPSIPLFRNDCVYEELTFVPNFLRQYRPADYDATVTCSYPFTNWILRRSSLRRRGPPHIFVTQNGDWPAYSGQTEYRYFGCDALVCTNPDFFERNRSRWSSYLIPNGIDIDRFKPGKPDGESGLPTDRMLVLMVSALIPSKRVTLGIEVVHQIPNAHLVIAGDGPLREEVKATAARLIPDRFTLLSVPAEQMPALYRAATVFLHLSEAESFGNVFLEAMASGLPIVGHDLPRLRWIVGNDEFLIDSGNHSAIIDAINAASAVPFAKRSEQRLRAASFSWRNIGEMYRNVLREVVRMPRN